jgi:hypothetical protein
MSQINTPSPTQDNASEWSLYLKAIFDDKDNKDRKAKSKELVDYYNDEQSVYLQNEMSKLYGGNLIKDKRKWTQNILKKVMDALAITYAGSTKRDVQNVEDSADKKQIQDLFFYSLNNVMSSVNKFLVRRKNNSCSTVLLSEV